MIFTMGIRRRRMYHQGFPATFIAIRILYTGMMAAQPGSPAFLKMNQSATYLIIHM
jgi:hypothetical protein